MKDTNEFSVDGTMDVQIKYSDKERLELAQSLAGKRSRVEKLTNEMKATTKEMKDEIKGIETEIASDINTLESGVRHIPAAQVRATLNKEKRLVTIKYKDQVVANEKLDPEKHRGLFGDLAVH